MPKATTSTSRANAAGLPSVQRARVTTALGDPNRLDMCSAEPSAGGGTGGDAIPAEDNGLSVCGYRIEYSGSASITGLVAAIQPSQEPRHATSATTSRHGTAILIAPKRVGTSCQRFVRLSGVTISIDARKDGAAPDPSEYCTAADFLTTRVLNTLGHGGFSQRAFATPTISTIDFCRVLSQPDVQSLIGQGPVRRQTLDFDSACRWSNTKYVIYAGASTTSSFGKIDADHTVVAGHTLIDGVAQASSTQCTYSSPQGRISATRSEEFLDVTLTSRTKDSPAHLCGLARQAVLAILSKSGLH
jgi:hypothetical protein